MRSPLKTCLFGASPSTGNQGVNALCWSTLYGVSQRGCSDLHIFDYGQGSRQARFDNLNYTLHGMTIGKRLWHRNHLGTARLAAAAGFRRHGLLSVVADSELVLDVSGGDSFTDLYGGAPIPQYRRSQRDCARPWATPGTAAADLRPLQECWKRTNRSAGDCGGITCLCQGPGQF